MTRVLLSGTAAFLMSGAAAFAGGLAPPIQPIAPLQAYAAPASCPVVQPVISALQAQGFTRIEVDTGPTQARFAALRGGQRNVFVYDCTSGALLGQEAERVAGGFAPGVIGVDGDDGDFVVVGIASGDDTGANGGTGGAGVDAGGDDDIGTDGGVEIGDGGQVGDTGVDVGGSLGTGGDLGSDAGAGGDAGTDGQVGGDVGGGIGVDSNRRGCDRSDLEGSENAPNDNCGGGNNTGGVDPDNPGAGQGAGRTGGVNSNGNGPGNGGLGGNGNGG